MQRELVLDIERPVAEALTRALEAMIEEARKQAARAIEEPADAVHQYRRALRRAEAVLDLSWPMMRKQPRQWLERSLARARRRTRVARDLDAVLPMVGKLEALDLFAAEDGSLAAMRTWLEACRAELASDEIVAWRLRKNARALAGLAEIFQAAIHAWVDHELVLDRLRESYRVARKAWRQAADSGKAKDVHALRRAARKLRYQLELLASARAPKAVAPAEGAGAAVGGDSAQASPPAGEGPSSPSPSAAPARPEPAWVGAVVDLHDTVKGLVKELGAVTDLMALRAIVDEADRDSAEFDAGRLTAILGELLEGRIERALGEAERAFVVPSKRLLIEEPAAKAPSDAPAGEVAPSSEGAAAGAPSTAQGEDDAGTSD